jgi:putative flippase GtrA
VPSPTFVRSNVTSLFTTALDFATLAALKSGLGVNYVLATWMGTVVGSVSNFLINKHWAFQAKDTPPQRELGRFLLVQAGASMLHTAGVWLLTRYAGFHYLESKLIAALVVYLAWNYPLNRSFVFRRDRDRDRDA